MKLAIITGGTQGIGKALVSRFAQAGFGIVTCARSRQDLLDLQTSVGEAHGVPVHILPTDLADAEQVKAFGTFALSIGEPLVLVNNAGLYATGKLLEEDESQFATMWRVNVESVYHLTRQIAPVMVARRQGHIFNICSIASTTAFENNGAYCTSKFAVYGMTKVLRQEVKDADVKVTAVLPGATHTNSWAGVDIAPERLIAPEDVAEAVLAAYLLSPRAVLEELTIRPQLGDL